MEQNYGGYSSDQQNEPVMTMKDWIITLLIQMVPCVGIIMTFVWAFGDGNLNRKNWAKASLIMTLIGIVLGVILYVLFFAAVLAALSQQGYTY